MREQEVHTKLTTLTHLQLRKVFREIVGYYPMGDLPQQYQLGVYRLKLIDGIMSAASPQIIARAIRFVQSDN